MRGPDFRRVRPDDGEAAVGKEEGQRQENNQKADTPSSTVS